MSDSQKRHQGRNILWGEARLSWLAMRGWPWAVGRPSTRPTAEPLRSLKTVILRAQQRRNVPCIGIVATTIIRMATIRRQGCST